MYSGGSVVLVFVLFFVLAGLGFPIARAVLRRRGLRGPPPDLRSGLLAEARVVEVSLAQEGSDGGEYPEGPLDPDTRRRFEETLPIYRVLLRYAPHRGGEIVADTNVRLSPRELDTIAVDRPLTIRYDPASPGRVIVDPVALRDAAGR
jgi:hypothetical protein